MHTFDDKINVQFIKDIRYFAYNNAFFFYRSNLIPFIFLSFHSESTLIFSRQLYIKFKDFNYTYIGSKQFDTKEFYIII